MDGTSGKAAFSTFSASDLLRGNTWKGSQMSLEVLEAIKSEAATFRRSMLWKVLKSELEWFAIRTLLEAGKTEEDLRIARIFGNIVQVVDKKLEDLTK